LVWYSGKRTAQGSDSCPGATLRSPRPHFTPVLEVIGSAFLKKHVVEPNCKWEALDSVEAERFVLGAIPRIFDNLVVQVHGVAEVEILPSSSSFLTLLERYRADPATFNTSVDYINLLRIQNNDGKNSYRSFDFDQ
jgi:hypothetical protein